jgi:hypothetical protein
LEYLACFNYDTETAWFNLTCNLSCGKGDHFVFHFQLVETYVFSFSL